MTTNHKHVLDPALVRPGRCDIHATLGNCTRAQLRMMFRAYYASEDLPDAVDVLLRSADGEPSSLSPASACNIMLAHRGDAAAAADALIAALAPPTKAGFPCECR